MRLARRASVAALLCAGDAAALAAAGALSGLPDALVAASAATPLPTSLLLLLYAWAGLYGGRGPSPVERLRGRALAVLGFACLAGTVQILHQPQLQALVALPCFALLVFVLGFYVEALMRRLLIRLGLWGAPTAIVGTSSESEQLARMLLAQPELGLRPLGFLLAPGETAAPALPLPVLGEIASSAHLRDEIEVALVTGASLEGGAWPDLPFARVLLAQACGVTGARIRTRPLGDRLGIELCREIYRPRILRLKRAFDLAVAVPALAAAAPLVLALVLLVRAIDPGPAFFVQTRVGRNGRPIRVFKLRTMYADAEARLEAHLASDPAARAEWQSRFKLSRDPRILPVVGRFLRKSSLDELPQLLNVVRGDISLVGPRPFPAYHLDSFTPRFRALRASVPPGLTGLWQVTARSDGDLAVQELQDTAYITGWSVWLDIYVVLQTAPAVLFGQGAR